MIAMKKHNQPKKKLIAATIAAIGFPLPLIGAPLDLAQYPAGSAFRMPAPNVILSVDSSGSMNNLDGTGKKRIDWLKEGLQNTLINQSTYDSKFRLAWQSFACDNIPSNNGGCQGKNTMGIFSGTHKTNFSNWVTNLTENGWTPSHKMVWNAGEYLKKTGADSPWNTVPGTADSNPLSCRRAYHIFLSDGGWNRYREDIIPSFNAFDFQTKMRSNSPDRIGDADRTDITLPDGKKYATANVQTKVYQGAGGDGTAQYSYNVTTNPGSIGTCNRWTKLGQCNLWQITREYSYPTLSDMAFHYWSTDLQTSIDNKVIPDIVHSGDETFVSGGNSLTLDEYWNPKNNPATWQHMKHFTIGYGKTASQWTNSGTNPLFTTGMYDGAGFSGAVTGVKMWTDTTLSVSDTYYDRYRPEELWHMAINSRGEYFPVSGGDLTPVFEKIFGAIMGDTSQPVTSFTSASGSVSRVGTSAYQASYVAADDQNSQANRWYGYVSSNSVATSGATTPNAAWGTTGAGQGVTTADKLDALAPSAIPNRLVLSFNDQTRRGISFEWSSTSSPLSAAQRSLLKGTDSDAVGQNRVDFIRGDRSKEANQTGGTFRIRKSRQGDIVNSAIWFTGQPASAYSFGGYKAFASAQRQRTPMLYVGGNDGMLHGFSATDGAEKIAYIPQGVIKNLPALTRPNYDHQYYVDGSPFTGDLKLGAGNTAADWATYLVGTLGAGGKGFFVLDVTSPGSTDGLLPSDFVKAKAENLVVMDKTAFSADPADPDWPDKWKDIGYIFGNPVVAENNTQRTLQITRTNDNRWAVILGNGYNSENERPVLLIQYLDGDKSLKTIPAVTAGAEAQSNGLSTPQFLDVNADGIPDFVYAGDLRGNMWKFDIASNDPAQWKVAFGGSPLFTATYTAQSGSISRQPITTPPVMRPNREVGGLMVAFGTGRNITEGDRTDVSKQSLYSILDNTRYEVETATGASRGKVKVKASNPTPTTVTRAELQSQSVDDASERTGSGISAGRTFWKLDATRVKYDCTGAAASCSEKKGWYMNLPETGERLLASIDFYDGGNLLEIITEVPASGSATADGEETCTPSPRAVKNFRTLLNIATGMPAGAPLMNVDGNTTTDANGVVLGLYNSADAGFARMTSSPKELRVSTKFEQRRAGSDGIADNLAKLPELMLRPNWRQLQ